VTGFDFVVLAILVVSGVLGLVRGLLKEVLSLVAYLLAFVAAIWWGPTVYTWLEPYIETTLLRMGVSYAVVFILVLLGVGLVNMTLAALIRSTGLSPADHGLGGMFGLARGLLIVLALVALLQSQGARGAGDRARFVLPCLRAVRALTYCLLQSQSQPRANPAPTPRGGLVCLPVRARR